MVYAYLVQGVWGQQRALLAESLSQKDRMLILGSGGWFGHTCRVLVDGLAVVMPHNARTSDQTKSAFESAVEAFAPTIVANFAFLTPHFTRTLAQSDYVATNLRVFERFEYAASRPGVRMALHASSGAVTTAAEDLSKDHLTYRQLKQAEEEAIRSGPLAEHCLIVRTFSVSGPFVRIPEKYAFSDMIGQALLGRIRIHSDRPTYRRYCSVVDLLTAGLLHGIRFGGGLVESGGPLVEMRELASVISRLTTPEPELSPAEWITEEPSVYASDGQSWTVACRAVGLEPMELERQVREVQSYLLAGMAGS